VAFGPLYLSSTENRLLAAEIADPSVTRFGGGVAFLSNSVPLGERVPGGDAPLYEAQQRAFAARVARSPALGRVFTGILTPPVSLSPVGSHDERIGRLMFRTDVLSHIEVRSGAHGPGLWMPEVYADGLDVRPGDTVSLAHEGGPPVEVAVAGVYRTLSTGPRSGYWRSWYGEIWPCLLCDPPPQPVFADRGLIFDLIGRLGIDTASFAWDAPIRPDAELTIPEARDLGAFARAFLDDMSGGDGRLNRVFQCCGARFRPFRTRNAFLSAIPSVLTVVDRRMAALEGPVQLLALAALLVALASVAGAGAFATAARRVESALLSARGRGPLTMGLKGALEAVLPALVGAGLGLGITLLLVRALGPGGAIPGSVLLARAAAVAVAVAVRATTGADLRP
jgi:putative ABC transport system permease protein